MPAKGTTQRKVVCLSCDEVVALQVTEVMRRHPQGAKEACPAIDWKDWDGIARPKPPPEAPAAPEPRKPAPLATRTPIVAPASDQGFVKMTITAYHRVPEGVSRAEEEQRLYDDPNHLYRALDDIPNEHFNLTLRGKWS